MPIPILIDCDPGYDDVIAIMLALASPEVEVLAIARCTFIRPSPNSCRRCCPTSDR
jgi:inosine-uridine nucleoside N-ribohydrolase